MNLRNKLITQKLSLNILTTFSLMIITFLFCMLSPLNPLEHTMYCGTDSSVFKTVALYMKNGFMPYKDIFDHKGPLLYIYNWIGIELSYWRGIWYIEAVSLFITFIAMYKICRLLCGRFCSIIILLVSSTPLFQYFEGGNLTEEYAMPFIAVSLYIYTDYFVNKHVSKLRLFICGLSLGAVLLLRPNMISVWVVFSLAVLFEFIRQKNFISIMKFAMFFVLGILSILGPIFVWLAFNGAFTDFIHDYLIFNSEYVSGDRAALINKFRSFVFFSRNFFILSSIVCSIYLLFTEKNTFHTAYFLSICCTLILICISGQTYAHYGMVFIPLQTYPLTRILCKFPNLKSLSKVGLSIMCFFLFINTFLPWIHHVRSIVKPNSINITENKINEVVTIVKSETAEDDVITVLGNWNIIYVLSERLSASKYSYQAPLTEVNPIIAEKYFTDLEQSKPKLIVITSDYYDETSYEYQKMMDFITTNNYTSLTTVDDILIYTSI